jgi:hypothetical protein
MWNAIARTQMLFAVLFASASAPVWGQGAPDVRRFDRSFIDATVESNAHKPKVLARFSKDGFNDLGSLDKNGFKLYRFAENWKVYTIFAPGAPGGFEDAAVADINADGANDIVLGGWSNRTIWAENPLGKGEDPYRTQWRLHEVDSGRFSHEVCAVDLDHDGNCDIITTSGVYLQGPASGQWKFIDIGRCGQGTCAGMLIPNESVVKDVVALFARGDTNQIAWFENPRHLGAEPTKSRWNVHVIDANPGGNRANRDMTCMAFALGDVNGDGRPDIVSASQGEGPDAADDARQVGDGLVWYEAPTNPRTDHWVKHEIDPSVAWVHASSIQLADFDGDGNLDVSYAEQDQSKDRRDGNPGRRLGVFYNVNGGGRAWTHVVLSRFPEEAAGGFNSKVGFIGNDRLPSIFTSLHGFFGDRNPLVLWRNPSAKH